MGLIGMRPNRSEHRFAAIPAFVPPPLTDFKTGRLVGRSARECGPVRPGIGPW